MVAKVEHTLEPWFDSQSRVLVLGTMPSPKSREYGCYYGHPQNRFWSTLSKVFQESIGETAEERRLFVLRHRIALWDVLASCDIHGAEDASISEPIPNDLSRILNASCVQTIFTTGTKAKQLYDRLLLPTYGLEAMALPSTSPANRCFGSEDVLFREYTKIRLYI